MHTFSIQTLGCKVNQYESDQIATLLRNRGLTQVEQGGDLRVVHTCSVTTQAAAKSRHAVRRAGRLALPVLDHQPIETAGASRVIVTGCWATSDPAQAATLPGVNAVVPNTTNVADEIHRLLDEWSSCPKDKIPEAKAEVESNGENAELSKSLAPRFVNENFVRFPGTMSLPLLDGHRLNHQRGQLKIQDGCDAHCTYCIIPQLRPTLSSKPIDAAVEEAQRLVDAGHAEIVLTGIFLGAYGQATALRRGQNNGRGRLADLVTALCKKVRGLRRLRLSSLEPGDLTPELLSTLASFEQVAPHFHLPLQSGSDRLLRKMNRQYTRDDYLRMLDAVRSNFDRPALTTDIIVGFPGESDEEFERTREIVRAAGFIYIHAFSFSPRPGTAAARWTKQFVRGPIVNHRISELNRIAAGQNYAFRQSFVGEEVEVIVENTPPGSPPAGRCQRYFTVTLPICGANPGDVVRAFLKSVNREWSLAS